MNACDKQTSRRFRTTWSWILPVLVTIPFSVSSQSVEEIYQINCAQCHGKAFEGGNAQSMVDGIWQFGSGAGAIGGNIANGITHLGMPAYGTTLSSKQIKELAAYILEAEKRTGAVKPPPPSRLQTLDYDIDVEVWVKDLKTPWSVAFLTVNEALITERAGQLRVVKDNQLLPEPVKGTPVVISEGQGGLLDVAVDPDYENTRWIYLVFSHGLDNSVGKGRVPAMTKVVRGRIKDHTWTDEETLFEAKPEHYLTSRVHFGSRIAFDSAGDLYFSIGDRGEGAHAQSVSLPNGKIHRIHRDGSIPDDNPFVKTEDAVPSIYSYGNRNPQGISAHPQTGRIWAAEHGPLGGDELNLISKGLNYGWPVISYGKNYNGTVLTELIRQEGMEQPIWYWNPSTAVCGIDFYQGLLFPKWNNRLLVGALKYEDVRVLNIEKDRVMHEEVILKNAGRVRDVLCGPDGAIYVVLNSPDVILRFTPAKVNPKEGAVAL